MGGKRKEGAMNQRDFEQTLAALRDEAEYALWQYRHGGHSLIKILGKIKGMINECYDYMMEEVKG